MASNSYFHLFALVVTILGLAHSGDGVKCYECSQGEYGCGDPFSYNRFPLVDCDRKNAHNTYLQSYSVCRKSVTRVNGELQVERSCAWQQQQNYNNEHPCHMRGGPYTTVEHCSTCQYDGCNGVSGLIPSVWTTTLTTTALYMGAKLF